MPNRRELGFPSAALLIIFFAPLFALVIRRKWRLAAARREEVMRLVFLASEETARAEIECAQVYSSDSSLESASVIKKPQCAVCYRPTTTRCSRCKAVRYCSGECQIVHWRLGHKEDCHRLHTDLQYNAPGSVSVSEAVQVEKSSICESGCEILTSKPSEVPQKEPSSSDSSCSSAFFSKEDVFGATHLGDDSRTEGISNSYMVSSSYSCSISATSAETLDGTCVMDGPVLPPARSDDFLSCVIAPDSCSTTADVCGTIRTKYPPSNSPCDKSPVNISYCPSKSNQKALSSITEEDVCDLSNSVGSTFIASDDCIFSKYYTELSECQTSAFDSSVNQGTDLCSSKLRPKDATTLLKSGSTRQFSRNWSGQDSGNKMPSNGAVPFEDMSMGKSRASPDVSVDVLASVAKKSSNNERMLKSRGTSHLSSVACADRTSSTGGGHLVFSLESPNMNTTHEFPARLSKATSFSSTGNYDLKTSMRKFIMQFKSAKLRHHPSGFESGNAGKCNYKIVFPYDLFIKLYNEKADLRPYGLINCGNSCYANAVLQCLSFTRPLTAYFLQGLHTRSCHKRDWCFTCEFESLVLKAKQGKCTLSPIGILSQIHNIGSHLGHGKEEDAHEFLRYAIDAMQSVCLKEAGVNAVGPFAEETTLIQLIFGGYLRSKIKCLRCHGKSERRERILDLTVEIHGDIETLENALTRFTATELLEGENKYQCNRCKSYERAKKKLTICEAPNILTISLKRFQCGKFGKLNKAVRFPEILDLSPYMDGTSDKSPVYKLYAVVVHLDIMNAAFSGHYVCYVKTTSGKWYKIDDSTVKPVDLDRVLSKKAYMLLYARFSPRATSLIRSGMPCDYGKIDKNRSVVASNQCEGSTQTRSGCSTLRPPYPLARAGVQDSPNWNEGGRSDFDPFDLFYQRYSLRKLQMDSSSDSSSLFSYSDEGSCSTESTTGSTSTDEYSDYVSGELNSPYRFSEDSNGFTFSPLHSRFSSEVISTEHKSDSPSSSYSISGFSSLTQGDGGVSYQDLSGKESPSFLPYDTTRQRRELAEQGSSSSSRSTSRDMHWVDPFKKNYSVFRRSTRDRAQRIY